MAQTARTAAIATLVAASILALLFALWELKVLFSLFLLGLVLAAAMRPGVEWLRDRGIAQGFGIALHYIALGALIAVFLWLVVPNAIDQLSEATGGQLPTSQAELEQATREAKGVKHDVLVEINQWLQELPSGASLVDPALELGTKAIEVIVAIFFVLATAAYWIFERDRARNLVVGLVAKQHRTTVRETWELIDLKLGAFVRGQAILVVFVAALLSPAFWAIGVPYWLLLGVFAGVVELIPVIGPLAAGAVAVGAGLTVSWKVAALAAIAVFAVRMLEDYIVIPKVLGHAVGLSPLVVLVAVTSLGLLLGGIYVLLAIPLAAIVGTLIDVIVLDRDPAEEEVPAVLFPAQDAETV